MTKNNLTRLPNLLSLTEETQLLIKQALKDGGISDRWAWCFEDTIVEIEQSLRDFDIIVEKDFEE